jgi:cytochrome b subunit of formate dehydrogenase
MSPDHTLNPKNSRHKRWVKGTHWIITVSFLVLAYSGYVILKVHPRLYWGEVGNSLTPALFELPISRNYSSMVAGKITHPFLMIKTPRSA